MKAVLKDVHGLELDSFWSDEDPSVMHRGHWLLSAEEGADATAVTYFEIDPGKRIGMHTHDAEETIVVMQASGEVLVSDDSFGFAPGAVIFVPEGAAHDVRNTSAETFRAVSFFPAPEVASVFEVVLQPAGSRELGTSSSG